MGDAHRTVVRQGGAIPLLAPTPPPVGLEVTPATVEQAPGACFMARRDPEAGWLVRVDTGEVVARPWPVGTMWFEDYSEGRWLKPKGPDDWSGVPEEEVAGVRARHGGVLPAREHSHVFEDGPCLCVQTPGGTWNIDSRASNCTMPYDYEHRCWIRHGEPPNITVDKAGKTCSAGGGSIQCGSYHGFLQYGRFT